MGMEYLDENGLARYDGLIKNWVTFKSGTVDGVAPLLNWQKTDTAASVTCHPLPAAPIDPTVNFAFTETGPAEGTKGPDNPSTITGVSSITVTRCETVGVDSTDYVIDLNGTFYGGSVDLSAGTMTVTHKGYVFDGSEAWSGPDDHDGIVSFGLSVTKANGIGSTGDQLKTMTHFPYIYSAFDKTNHFYIAGSGTFLAVYTSVHSSTKQEFKEWLSAQKIAGTPVTLAYYLYQPYTVQLTPTQIYSLSQPDTYTPRLNTVYSDQQSVQVGYPKSPQATAVELTNAIISLGGNV